MPDKTFRIKTCRPSNLLAINHCNDSTLVSVHCFKIESRNLLQAKLHPRIGEINIKARQIYALEKSYTFSAFEYTRLLWTNMKQAFSLFFSTKLFMVTFKKISDKLMCFAGLNGASWRMSWTSRRTPSRSAACQPNDCQHSSLRAWQLETLEALAVRQFCILAL